MNRQYLIDAWTKMTDRADVSSFDYTNEQAGNPDVGATAIIVPIALRDQKIGQVSIRTRLPRFELRGSRIH